jgi:hypothetical protein
MKLVEFRPFVKNSLRGFATVELKDGLMIADCPVHAASSGRLWASLPAKAMLDRDGKQIVVDGKKQYDAILKWRDRELGGSEAVVTLVRAEHPEALS